MAECEVTRGVSLGDDAARPTCLKNISVLSLVWLEVRDSFIPVTDGALLRL